MSSEGYDAYSPQQEFLQHPVKQHGNTRIKQNEARRLDHAKQELLAETKFKNNLMRMMETFKQVKNSLIEMDWKTNKHLEEINKSLKKYLHLNQIAKCLPCNGIELEICLYCILLTDLQCIVTGWGYLTFSERKGGQYIYISNYADKF